MEYYPPASKALNPTKVLEVDSLKPLLPKDDLATKLVRKLGSGLGAAIMSDAPHMGSIVGETLGEYFLHKIRRRCRK